MTIDEKDYLEALERIKQKDTKDFDYGRGFNAGIQYAIDLMKLHQEEYYKNNLED